MITVGLLPASECWLELFLNLKSCCRKGLDECSPLLISQGKLFHSENVGLVLFLLTLNLYLNSSWYSRASLRRNSHICTLYVDNC